MIKFNKNEDNKQFISISIERKIIMHIVFKIQ